MLEQDNEIEVFQKTQIDQVYQYKGSQSITPIRV